MYGFGQNVLDTISTVHEFTSVREDSAQSLKGKQFLTLRFISKPDEIVDFIFMIMSRLSSPSKLGRSFIYALM